MEYLAHRASLAAWWSTVPPHRGIKHLDRGERLDRIVPGGQQPVERSHALGLVPALDAHRAPIPPTVLRLAVHPLDAADVLAGLFGPEIVVGAEEGAGLGEGHDVTPPPGAEHAPPLGVRRLCAPACRRRPAGRARADRGVVRAALECRGHLPRGARSPRDGDESGSGRTRPSPAPRPACSPCSRSSRCWLHGSRPAYGNGSRPPRGTPNRARPSPMLWPPCAMRSGASGLWQHHRADAPEQNPASVCQRPGPMPSATPQEWPKLSLEVRQLWLEEAEVGSTPGGGRSTYRLTPPATRRLYSR